MAETAFIGVDIDRSLVNRRLAETGELTAKEARDIERNLVSVPARSTGQRGRGQADGPRAVEGGTRCQREAKRAAREIEQL